MVCHELMRIIAKPIIERNPKLRFSGQISHDPGIESSMLTRSSCFLPRRRMSSASLEVPAFSTTTTSALASSVSLSPWLVIVVECSLSSMVVRSQVESGKADVKIKRKDGFYDLYLELVLITHAQVLQD